MKSLFLESKRPENNRTALSELEDFTPEASYRIRWFDPVTGEWGEVVEVAADRDGTLEIRSFPCGKNPSDTDHAARIKKIQ